MSEATQENKKSVVDYLATLVWDGTPRLDRWLIDCAGAEDTPHVRAASRTMLVAAVRRARDPGCRFDQLLVIEGPQGSGKSAALRLLAVDASWFTDDLPLGSDSRRVMESTGGKWLVEASELTGMSHADAAWLKMYLSRTHDEARMAYERDVTRVPRPFVVIGTANVRNYLSDATGNRRIVLVRIQGFDLDRLRSIRDQLWAEAAVIEVTGASIQLPEATEPS